MEADLRREYGVRLRDLFTGDLTWRELASYVHGLSAQSATRTALNEGKPEPSAETVLLADMFDMLQHVDWHIQAMNAAKKSDLPKKPTPYPRYWDAGRRGKKHSPERLAHIKDAQRRATERRRLISQGAIA